MLSNVHTPVDPSNEVTFSILPKEIWQFNSQPPHKGNIVKSKLPCGKKQNRKTSVSVEGKYLLVGKGVKLNNNTNKVQYMCPPVGV